MQITAAEREFKRAEDAWGIHVIPERDFKRARDDLETAKLNYAHAIETGGLEKDSLQLELRSQRAQRDAQALKVARLRERVDALTLKSPVAGMVATLSAAGTRAGRARTRRWSRWSTSPRSRSNSRSPRATPTRSAPA